MKNEEKVEEQIDSTTKPKEEEAIAEQPGGVAGQKDQEAPEDSDGSAPQKESPKRLCTEANKVSTNTKDSTIEPQNETKAETGSNTKMEDIWDIPDDFDFNSMVPLDKQHYTQQTPKVQAPEARKGETGIKIRVGDAQKDDIEEERPQGIEDVDNPYLYDCSGPKKVIDYSKADDYEDVMQTLSFDMADEAQAAFASGN